MRRRWCDNGWTCVSQTVACWWRSRSCPSDRCWSHKCWRNGWIITDALREWNLNEFTVAGYQPINYCEYPKYFLYLMYLFVPQASDNSTICSASSDNSLLERWWLRRGVDDNIINIHTHIDTQVISSTLWWRKFQYAYKFGSRQQLKTVDLNAIAAPMHMRLANGIYREKEKQKKNAYMYIYVYTFI